MLSKTALEQLIAAWPCRRLSMAMVALLREPLGLPVLPAAN